MGGSSRHLLGLCSSGMARLAWPTQRGVFWAPWARLQGENCLVLSQGGAGAPLAACRAVWAAFFRGEAWGHLRSLPEPAAEHPGPGTLGLLSPCPADPGASLLPCGEGRAAFSHHLWSTWGPCLCTFLMSVSPPVQGPLVASVFREMGLGAGVLGGGPQPQVPPQLRTGLSSGGWLQASLVPYWLPALSPPF